jgi:hypothetical protein
METKVPKQWGGMTSTIALQWQFKLLSLPNNVWRLIVFAPFLIIIFINCGKVCPTNCDFFLAYLIQLDVDVTGNITAKLCEVGSEFNLLSTQFGVIALFFVKFSKC